MKAFHLTFILLILSFAAFAQEQTHQYDSVIFKTLERNMQHPYDETGAVAGATLLEFAKRDSVITMHSVYSTAKAFDFIERAAVLKRINDRLNKMIPAGFSIIVPVYFYYVDATEPDAKEEKEFEKKIKELKRHKRNVSERPVTIYEVAVERKRNS